MIERYLGILTVALLLTLQTAYAGPLSLSTEAPRSAPMTLAQTDTTASTPPLTCCFGGAASGQCTQSSPNQPGCEFVMAYTCGKAGYSCDPDKGVCVCNTAAAESGQLQPSQ
jgi:hypothetical protein